MDTNKISHLASKPAKTILQNFTGPKFSVMAEKPPKVGKAMAGVAPHTWNLQVIGFYRLPPGTRRLYKWPHEAYMASILALVLVYTAQEVIYCIQVRADLDKVVEVSFILLTHFDCISKLLIFRYRADRVQRMLDDLDGATYTRHAAHTTFVRDTTVAMCRLLRAFTGAAMVTCFLWYLFPYFDHHQGVPVVFPIWAPGVGDTNVSPAFDYLLLYTSVQKALQGFANTTMDAFVSAIYAFIRTHVTILRYNLEHLPETCDHIVKTTGEGMEVVIKREFESCMNHYNLVLDVSKELQDVFGGVILFQFIVSGWIICMTAYNITDMNPASVEFVSMMLYMSCILVELYIFCYYGNELTIESDGLVESVYSMQWLQTPLPHRKSMILFMERAKRPIRPITGAIIPLSMPTFMKILKSSYTFYALLRETK